MSLSKDGIMIILSSPSGAGKTTLVKKISTENNFVISISHTTRIPRKNEINGKDYFFISKDEFQKLIKNDELLEYAKVFNNLYGSTKKKVFENLNNGKHVIFDIDWQGAEQIKKKVLKYKLITFFILPPSRKVLFDRLLSRDSENQKIAEERMKQFDKDVLHWKDYDYVVINDDLEKCYNQIISIINSSIKSEKDNYRSDNIKNHIQKLLQ